MSNEEFDALVEHSEALARAGLALGMSARPSAPAGPETATGRGADHRARLIR